MRSAAFLALAFPWLVACGGARPLVSRAPSSRRATEKPAPQVLVEAPAPRLAMGVEPEPTRTVAPADGALCPADMVTLPGFCIDRYEAPNVAGARPFSFQDAQDGEAWCSERGKRLCSESEWVRACEGSAKHRFPYGDRYEAGRCNDDKEWKTPKWNVLGGYPAERSFVEANRLNQASPSGTHAGCATEDGVHDLVGNVAEWVSRSYPTRKNFDHVIKGCFWGGCYHEPEPSCSFTNGAHPGSFRSYEVGFRCCRAPTDAR